MKETSQAGVQTPAAERVSFGTKFGYGIGDIASNIFIVASGFYLLFFLTNVLHIEPAVAGIVLFFPKLWDVIADPIMGGISDVTRSRWGRRRPFLLFGAVPFGLTFFLIFLAPGYESGAANALHTGLMFALGCTAFALINVPYSSMVAEMSDDYNERMSITSFRMISSSVGVLLAGGLAMPLVQAGGGGAQGFAFMGALFGAAIALITIACFWGTKNARSRPAGDRMPPIREQVRVALQNFPFLMLVASYAMQSIGIGVLMAGMIYFIKHVMLMPETAMGIIFPILFGTAIVFIPVWVKIGVRLGKIRAYRIGICLISVMLASTFFTGPGDLYLFYVQIFVLGIGFSSFQLFPFSMLPDTIEYDEMKSGLRREGIFAGAWASGQKMAYSIGPGIMGFALSLSGFQGGDVQPESAVLGIRIAFCLFPALTLIASLVPFSRYDLTEARFEEIKSIIRKNR